MNAESAATENECLTLAFDGPVATLTLRHGSMNAIGDALLDELAATFEVVAAHSEVSVLRIRSERRVFSAGADLRLVAGRLESASGADEMKATVRRFHEVYDRLEKLPVVTIAEIEGHALGGGLELALACDIRIASHDAKLGLPETKVGLLPGAGGTQRLTRLCGEGVAARIILSGDVVGGREAERIGLVQWSFEAADFGRSAAEIVSRTANLSPDAQKIAKNCIRLAVQEQTRGAQAEIELAQSCRSAALLRKRVMKFGQRRSRGHLEFNGSAAWAEAISGQRPWRCRVAADLSGKVRAGEQALFSALIPVIRGIRPSCYRAAGLGMHSRGQRHVPSRTRR